MGRRHCKYKGTEAGRNGAGSSAASSAVEQSHQAKEYRELVRSHTVPGHRVGPVRTARKIDLVPRDRGSHLRFSSEGWLNPMYIFKKVLGPVT